MIVERAYVTRRRQSLIFLNFNRHLSIETRRIDQRQTSGLQKFLQFGGLSQSRSTHVGDNWMSLVTKIEWKLSPPIACCFDS